MALDGRVERLTQRETRLVRCAFIFMCALATGPVSVADLARWPFWVVGAVVVDVARGLVQLSALERVGGAGGAPIESQAISNRIAVQYME